MLHLDAFRVLICSIWTSIEEVIPVQTLEVPGATYMPLLYQDAAPGECPTQIAISPSSHLQLRCS